MRNMSVDFYDMEQHATNLITFCTTQLSQILDSYSGKKLSIEPYFSVDTPINAKSTVLSGQYKITLNVGAYVAINNYYASTCSRISCDCPIMAEAFL